MPTFEVRTAIGDIFLALRYDLEVARQTAQGFAERWPPGVIALEGPGRGREGPGRGGAGEGKGTS